MKNIIEYKIGDKYNLRLMSILVGITLIVFTTQSRSQSVSLEYCLDKANAQSLSAAQLPMIREVLQKQQAIANANYMPKLSANGTATWQSEVTSLPIKLPNIEVPTVPKDQYRATLDLQQTIWDGGATVAQKQLNTRQSAIEEARIAQELYQLKEAISQTYFNIAILEEQLKVLNYLQQQIQNRIKKVADNQRFGTATNTQLKQLEVRQIELKQQMRDVMYRKKALSQTLSMLMGEALPSSFQTAIDTTLSQVDAGVLNRPELKLLQTQQELILSNKSLINAKYAPKLAFIGTLGYGRPGLNFLSNQFKTYGTVGLNLKLPIDQLYNQTAKHEKQVFDLQGVRLQKQIENFDLQQRIKLSSQQEEINRLKETLIADQQLLNLRKDISKTTEYQLDNGIVTPADYLEEIDNEGIVRQNLALHKVQLIQAVWQYNLLVGK